MKVPIRAITRLEPVTPSSGQSFLKGADWNITTAPPSSLHPLGHAPDVPTPALVPKASRRHRALDTGSPNRANPRSSASHPVRNRLRCALEIVVAGAANRFGTPTRAAQPIGPQGLESRVGVRATGGHDDTRSSARGFRRKLEDRGTSRLSRSSTPLQSCAGHIPCFDRVQLSTRSNHAFHHSI
jgi:hypothetical protein